MQDLFHLERFLTAQEHHYATALAEIRRGRKDSHWIWYVFPQLKGLGKSDYSQYYGISGLEEARAYLAHPVLRARLLEISQALLEQENRDPQAVMGHIDSRKLRSSMTLFAAAEPDCPVFGQVLDAFFGGQQDPLTLKLLARKEEI